MPVSYVQGDATQPRGPGERCIVHVVNDAGKWGRGFVMALSRRWPRLKAEYHGWSLQRDFRLGAVLYSLAEPGIRVAHMVAQRGVRGPASLVPLRYDFLQICLADVGRRASSAGWSVHMPRIGCGLAGGTWDRVGPIVESALAGLQVTVYDP